MGETELNDMSKSQAGGTPYLAVGHPAVLADAKHNDQNSRGNYQHIVDFTNAPIGIKIGNVQRSKSSKQNRARTTFLQQSNEILAIVNSMS